MTKTKHELSEDCRMPLSSANILEDRIEALRELFPEAFAEGKVDLQALRVALGQHVDDGRERYGLSWAGKAEAMRAIQVPSVGTLIPAPDESVNFETNGNVFIEGDNLEVLKLLQKSYYGKVKLIYIDPPYNTGNEFIYPDNFHEGLQDYLRYSGQVNGDGIKTSTNTEADGRFHSKWLSMMWPRLFLARGLLREDGLIFVSIDDHEVHHLRMLLNEIFGEEHFIAQIVVQSNKRGQTYKEISQTHEYLLVYSRGDDARIAELAKVDDALPYEDSKGKYDLWELRNRNPKFGRHNRPNLYFPIYVAPSVRDESRYSKVSLKRDATFSVEVLPKNSEGEDSCWRWSTEKISGVDTTSTCPVVVGKQKQNGGWNIYEKSRKSTTKAKSLWTETDVISEQGTIELRALGMGNHFDHPKPLGLLRKILNLAAEDGDLVLDFFAGSGTTGEAVYEVDASNGARRRFMLVQLPEPVESTHGYRNLADVTKERLRRAIKRVNKQLSEDLFANGARNRLDLGFKAFKLSSSNFKVWDGGVALKDPEQLMEQIRLFADNILPDRSQDAILHELVLKAGLPLTAEIETKAVQGAKVYSIAKGLLLVCLEDPLQKEVLRGMVDLKPQRILCLDHAFRGNDKDKVNALLEMRSHGIEFRTV